MSKKPTKKKLTKKPTKKKPTKAVKKKSKKVKKKVTKKLKKIHIVTTPSSIIKVDGVIVGRSPVDFTPEVKAEAEVKRVSPKPKPKKFKPEPSVYRKPSIAPPEGFEVLEVSEDDVGQAKKKISSLLNRICETIPYSCWVRTQSYPKANEVDGWLVVSGVKGVDTSSILSSIQEVMLPDVHPSSEDFKISILGKGYWISVGFHWQGTGDEEESDQYKKWHGMIEVSSNYRSMSDSDSIFKARSKILSAFSVGQLPSSRSPNSMITNIEKKFGQTISDIFVKIVWNSKNTKPERSEPETEDEEKDSE